MNKKTLISLIILVLFCLGLFFVIKSKLVIIEAPTNIDNGQTLFGPTIEEVVKKVSSIKFAKASIDWKEYSSIILGVKLFYPDYVDYIEISNGVSFYFNNPENKAIKEGRTYIAPDGGANISNHIPPSLDIVKIKSNVLPIEIKKECENYGAACEMTTFLGNQAEVFTWEGSEMSDNIYFINRNDLYAISMTYGSLNDEVIATYYKILSTLEFLK
jgi:hypothetical protein